MWASIWSSAVSKNWNSNLHCNILFILSMFSAFLSRDLHGKAASFGRPRPPDFTRSRQVYNLASSSSVCLCSNAGAYSIFSVSKFDHSHVLKLLCRSLFAYSHLLGFGIQVWTRETWRNIGNWYIVLVESNFLGNLHEVLHCLCRIQGSNFNGVVPRNWRVLPLCYPFCSNGLVC